MKRKLLVTLLAAITATSCAVGFTACGDEEETHKHAYGEWKTTLEATCTAEGKKERECTCGDKQTEKIDALGHDLTHHEAKAATCTSVGWNAYDTCSRCDYTTYVEISKTQHNFVNYVCTDCNEISPEAPFTEGLEFELNEDETGYMVIGIGTVTDDSIIIPPLYNGKPVTEIEDYAFLDCEQLISVTIPSSISDIYFEAFKGCKNLTNITLPESVVYISTSAFYDTAYYNNENNWQDDVLYIGNHLIEAKSEISGNYEIKSGTLDIADSAFEDCDGLTTITIPDGVAYIGFNTFFNCTGLTSVAIPDSVTYIGDAAFYDCRSLTSITIPDGVATIDWCTFEGCSGLTSITIPDSVTSISERAFSGCRGLTNITIPNSVTYIGEGAFGGCSGLTSVTIGNGVTSISNGAFNNCTSLTKVNIYDLASWCSIKFGTFTEENSFEIFTANPLYYAHNLYLDNKLINELIIPNSVTSIGELAFVFCTSLTSIAIPDSVTSIGGGAFGGCSGLTSITIPSSVASIDSSTFYGCSNLTSITLPDSVTSIGNSAFSNCSSLTSINIPNSVTSIGSSMFRYCTNLTSITIPDSITSIGGFLFEGCNLTNINFDGTIEQWKAIEKNSSWSRNTGYFTVQCTDGKLDKDDHVITE